MRVLWQHQLVYFLSSRYPRLPTATSHQGQCRSESARLYLCCEVNNQTILSETHASRSRRLTILPTSPGAIPFIVNCWVRRTPNGRAKCFCWNPWGLLGSNKSKLQFGPVVVTSIAINCPVKRHRLHLGPRRFQPFPERFESVGPCSRSSPCSR